MATRGVISAFKAPEWRDAALRVILDHWTGLLRLIVHVCWVESNLRVIVRGPKGAGASDRLHV